MYKTSGHCNDLNYLRQRDEALYVVVWLKAMNRDPTTRWSMDFWRLRPKTKTVKMSTFILRSHNLGACKFPNVDIFVQADKNYSFQQLGESSDCNNKLFQVYFEGPTYKPGRFRCIKFPSHQRKKKRGNQRRDMHGNSCGALDRWILIRLLLG